MTQLAASDGWTAWPAPAKLNLFLRILGRRKDGYHDLQTVFQLLDWGDTVHLRQRNDPAIERVGQGNMAIPVQEDLTVRAAKLLQKSANCSQGVDIFVEKVIPIGGGFGGGSSDAATVLVALNRLWKAGLNEDELATLGLELGADVPVFVRGNNAWAEGVGERLTPMVLPAAWYLLVDPGVAVSTRDLFQAPDLTRDADPATITGFVSGIAFGNAFEPELRRQQPAIDAALRQLSQFGPASVTGTGGGCFVRFSSRETALAAQSRLHPGCKTWVVAGVHRSPLHDLLDVQAKTTAAS